LALIALAKVAQTCGLEEVEEINDGRTCNYQRSGARTSEKNLIQESSSTPYGEKHSKNQQLEKKEIPDNVAGGTLPISLKNSLKTSKNWNAKKTYVPWYTLNRGENKKQSMSTNN